MHDLKIDKDKYQVFLFTCPATFPFVFARHPWFVVNRKGEISRWEIFYRFMKWEKRWGHLHKNFYSSFQGIPVFFFFEKFFWRKVKLLGKIEGDEKSIARLMADFIENSPNTYPYLDTYHFIGPNSNTYAQWVLDKFPEAGLRLPRNCIGKNHRISE